MSRSVDTSQDTAPLIVTFPVPAHVGPRKTRVFEPWSTNRSGQMHWRTRWSYIEAWRNAAASGVETLRLSRVVRAPTPALITVELPFRRAARRDPHNYVGTCCKAIVDGLVKAGLWADDTYDYLSVTEPKLVIGEVNVVVRIEART